MQFLFREISRVSGSSVTVGRMNNLEELLHVNDILNESNIKGSQLGDVPISASVLIHQQEISCPRQFGD